MLNDTVQCLCYTCTIIIRHLGLESEFKEIGKHLRKFRSFKKKERFLTGLCWMVYTQKFESSCDVIFFGHVNSKCNKNVREKKVLKYEGESPSHCEVPKEIREGGFHPPPHQLRVCPRLRAVRTSSLALKCTCSSSSASRPIAFTPNEAKIASSACA